MAETDDLRKQLDRIRHKGQKLELELFLAKHPDAQEAADAYEESIGSVVALERQIENTRKAVVGRREAMEKRIVKLREKIVDLQKAIAGLDTGEVADELTEVLEDTQKAAEKDRETMEGWLEKFGASRDLVHALEPSVWRLRNNG